VSFLLVLIFAALATFKIHRSSYQRLCSADAGPLVFTSSSRSSSSSSTESFRRRVLLDSNHPTNIGGGGSSIESFRRRRMLLDHSSSSTDPTSKTSASALPSTTAATAIPYAFPEFTENPEGSFGAIVEVKRKAYVQWAGAFAGTSLMAPETAAAIAAIAHNFELLQSTEDADHALAAWSNMLEMSCREYANEVLFNHSYSAAASEAAKKELAEQAELLGLEHMQVKYDLLMAQLQADAHNEMHNLRSQWSMPELLAEVMYKWPMSCTAKTNLLIFFWFLFWSIFIVLTLDAYHGSRFIFAYFYTLRRERLIRRRIAESSTRAKVCSMAEEAPEDERMAFNSFDKVGDATSSSPFSSASSFSPSSVSVSVCYPELPPKHVSTATTFEV